MLLYDLCFFTPTITIGQPTTLSLVVRPGNGGREAWLSCGVRVTPLGVSVHSFTFKWNEVRTGSDSDRVLLLFAS